MSTTHYRLDGREITGESEHGPCIFCGKVIAHLDAADAPDDAPRVGYYVNAVVDGQARTYLMHEIGDRCPERNAADALTVNGLPLDENTPEHERVVWRCGCDTGGGSFVENVGDLCPCGRAHADPAPWKE